MNGITGLVLAGGQGNRMGGADKGFVALNGRAMISYVLAALTPQVDTILINANRSLAAYRQLNYDVVTDASADFLGPLAGVESGLRQVGTPLMLTVPCDSPLIGPTLASRLLAQLENENAQIAVAHDGERLHPVFALLRTELHDSVFTFLSEGERKIDRWFARHRTTVVDFSDAPRMFLNVNRASDCAEVEAILRKAAAASESSTNGAAG